MNQLSAPRNSSRTATNVLVIGAGSIGLPTAGTLARFGHHVHVLDVDTEKIKHLGVGHFNFIEDGLDELLTTEHNDGRLHFTTDPTSAALCDYAFICVPTPKGSDGLVDTSFVDEAVASVRPHLSPRTVLVVKSTAPLSLVERIKDSVYPLGVTVVVNPEFLRMGTAVADSLAPSRIVVGSDDLESAERVADLFSLSAAPVHIVSSETAQLVKYAANSFLAARLSMVHEIADFCDLVGVDTTEVLAGLGDDPRIGHNYLDVAPGWGGSCFPKDTAALLELGIGYGFEFQMVRAAVSANESHIDRMSARIAALALANPNPTVAVLGLTFKPETGDRRHSVAIDVAARLVASGIRVQAFDPTVNGPQPDLADFTIATSAIDAIRGSHVTAVLTKWSDFDTLDWREVAAAMAGDTVVDTHNYLTLAPVKEAGLTYVGLGRS